jgi:outer membrane lipoprotein-sorting protein
MGCGLITNNTTIKISGLLQAASMPNPMAMTIESQGNTRWRSDLDTPKEHKVTIINDGKGQIQHADGRVTPLAQHNTYHQRPMHIPCLTNVALPLGQIDAVFVRSETTGPDTLDVIDLEPKSQPKEKVAAARMKTTVWVSRTTGYLAKLQYVNAAEQDASDTQNVEIEYKDYRVIDGLAIPFHQITHAGKLTLDLQIDSAQLNAQAADFNLR